MNLKNTDTRCGFVALIGETNAGKSTLLNQLIGQKIAIVSHKVQTTRQRLLGIMIKEQTQLIFMDTPGIFSAKKQLDRAMVHAAWQSLSDADYVLWIVDAAKALRPEELTTLKRNLSNHSHLILVLNKIDRVEKERLLERITQLTADIPIEKVFLVSALHGDHCQDIVDYLQQVLPLGPWHFPEDQITDMPMRVLAAEITREKIYQLLHQELPYAIHVETEHWEGFDNGDVKIQQVIHVDKEGQKLIVIGKNGQTLKKIGTSARQELSRMLGCKVHLKLFVKVTEGWQQKANFYADLGLKFDA